LASRRLNPEAHNHAVRIFHRSHLQCPLPAATIKPEISLATDKLSLSRTDRQCFGPGRVVAAAKQNDEDSLKKDPLFYRMKPFGNRTHDY
jgi:hypothetical protein